MELSTDLVDLAVTSISRAGFVHVDTVVCAIDRRIAQVDVLSEVGVNQSS